MFKRYFSKVKKKLTTIAVACSNWWNGLPPIIKTLYVWFQVVVVMLWLNAVIPILLLLISFALREWCGIDLSKEYDRNIYRINYLYVRLFFYKACIICLLYDIYWYVIENNEQIKFILRVFSRYGIQGIILFIKREWNKIPSNRKKTYKLIFFAFLFFGIPSEIFSLIVYLKNIQLNSKKKQAQLLVAFTLIQTLVIFLKICIIFVFWKLLLWFLGRKKK